MGWHTWHRLFRSASHMANVELDAEFLALPLDAVRSAVLDRARALGCEHAEARIERIRSQVRSLRDGRLETSADDLELGVGLRVVHEGSFGFAATVELDADAAAALVDQAVATATLPTGRNRALKCRRNGGSSTISSPRISSFRAFTSNIASTT